MARNYLFVRPAAIQPTEKAMKAKKVVTDFSEIDELTDNKGQFEFQKNEEMTKAYRKAEGLSISINDSGLYRGLLKKDATHTKNLRVYGIKGQDFPACDLTADQIKKVDFGVCVSDGEVQRYDKFNPVTGEVVSVPYIYVDLTPLTK